MTDALSCDPRSVRWGYAHPPWGLILLFLWRLPHFPALSIILVMPREDSSPWWPLLLRLRDPFCPPLHVVKHRGLL